MNRQFALRRIVSALLVVLLTAILIVPTTFPVNAANKRFITELRVEAGEDAVATLEADGWSVTMVGLNVASDSASQVYLAYKMNTGSPITNVILSPDVGDSYTDKDGIAYQCVSHVDVNEGVGGGAGCLYATNDAKAGEPLVGIDVLRGVIGEGEVLYPITNDGAEIVRTQNGAPADLEAGSDKGVVYLAQIRDGIVRPYISEIGVITDSDKWNAVYTACERGYNYYVDGDIDDSSDTYTIIAYERTADASKAVTNIAAVSEKAVQSLGEGQSDNAGAAVSISGAEYVSISGKLISAKEPYYIYRSKDKKAGNPAVMLYAETVEQKQNYLFGTWANGYFFSPGVTTAYTFSMNEDSYTKLCEDQTVLTKVPVRQLKSLGSVNKPTEAAENAQPVTKETAAQATKDEAATDSDKSIRLAMLTPRDGLPAFAASLTSLNGDPAAPYVERTERGDRVNKYQASVFGNGGGIALIICGAAIVGVAAYVIIRQKRSDKKESENSKKTNKSKKHNQSKKSR